MAEYEISYTASKPQSPPTGAGTIEWYIQPWAREVGTPDWGIVQNTGAVAYIATADLAAIDAMPHGTAAEKQAKNAAVIALLLRSLANKAAAILTGQTPDIVQQIAENNAAAVVEVDLMDTYITVTMGQTLPGKVFSMSLTQGTRRALLRGGKNYGSKVLGYGPIAYWPQNEKTGAVAYCRVNPAQNGAYTGVTLGQPGIGDGNTAPYYDGANDFTSIYSATFAGAFTSAQGTLAIWNRVAGAGVWTDGVARMIAQLGVDANNAVRVGKSAANNFLYGQHVAGGVALTRSIASGSLAWQHIAITWNVGADEVKVYLGGTQQGATLNGLGVWVGALSVVRTNIGADGNFPSAVWNGYLAHCAVWNRVLAPGEIAALATL